MTRGALHSWNVVVIDALNDTLTARGHHDSFLTYGLD